MPPEPVIINAAPLITGLVLEVDGWPNRRHSTTASIGTEPLEDGSEVTDHAVRLPRTMSLVGIVSTVDGPDRPAAAQAALNSLTGVVVEVLTEWETVPEALILSARTATEGRDMRVNLDLQEIIRVASPVEVPELSAAARAARERAARERAARAAAQTRTYGELPLHEQAAQVADRLRRIDFLVAMGQGDVTALLRQRIQAQYRQNRLLEGGRVQFTAQGDRYYRETQGGAEKLTFIDPANADLLQTSSGDYYLRQQDPQIAAATSDLWERHRRQQEAESRQQEAESARLLADAPIESPTIDPLGGPYPDPSTFLTGPRTRDTFAAARDDTTAGRGAPLARGRLQLIGGGGFDPRTAAERAEDEATALNV